jgi:hypothetical protein
MDIPEYGRGAAERPTQNRLSERSTALSGTTDTLKFGWGGVCVVSGFSEASTFLQSTVFWNVDLRCSGHCLGEICALWQIFNIFINSQSLRSRSSSVALAWRGFDIAMSDILLGKYCFLSEQSYAYFSTNYALKPRQYPWGGVAGGAPRTGCKSGFFFRGPHSRLFSC